MAGGGPSRQELIRRWRQGGFVGRQGELTAFRDALRRSPEETPQFVFHIHGQAGVGKSTLVRQLESAAREAEALTAYADESVADGNLFLAHCVTPHWDKAEQCLTEFLAGSPAPGQIAELRIATQSLTRIAPSGAARTTSFCRRLEHAAGAFAGGTGVTAGLRPDR